MANVTETSNYDEGVYQLETTDPLEGGPLGVLNKAIKNLANRTRWLKDQVTKLIPYAPIKRGFFNLDIGGASGPIAAFGDFLNASVTVTSNESFVTVNLINAMPNTNYKVIITMESRGDITIDNNVQAPVFQVISASQFKIGILESSSGGQNLRFHCDLIALD